MVSDEARGEVQAWDGEQHGGGGECRLILHRRNPYPYPTGWCEVMTMFFGIFLSKYQPGHCLRLHQTKITEKTAEGAESIKEMPRLCLPHFPNQPFPRKNKWGTCMLRVNTGESAKQCQDYRYIVDVNNVAILYLY